ncbi:MAG: hypothetical protein AAF383_05265 [Cyanobacteria bacterium P01_A01_bin.83]
MTTNIITIQDFVSREIIYCVSSLVYTLNKEGKLDEEYWNLLESIDWEEAEAEIQQNNCIVQEEVDLWGVYDTDTDYYVVDPNHDTKHQAIQEYFNEQNWDLHEYNREVYEHWLVSSYLGEKLKAKGETVEEFYGLTIWGRTTTGMAIAYDCVIKEIYDDLISK